MVPTRHQDSTKSWQVDLLDQDKINNILSDLVVTGLLNVLDMKTNHFLSMDRVNDPNLLIQWSVVEVEQSGRMEGNNFASTIRVFDGN